MSETTDAADVTGWLARLEETHKAVPEPFWGKCGCLAGLGEIPSASDCHQAGLCQMRQADRQRDADVRALMAAVRAVLALHEPIDDGGPNSGHCAEDGFSWPCPTVSAVAAAMGAEVTGR